MKDMKRIKNWTRAAVVVAALVAMVSCGKDRHIIGFWQQAEDVMSYVDEDGLLRERNLTDSAVTLNFMDNDTVLLSYGKENPLLNVPPSQLTDSLRAEIANIRNNLANDSLLYSLTENSLTIGGQEYELVELGRKFLRLSVSDSLEGRVATREITFYKPRK